MGIFASDTEQTVAIPFDEPHTVRIRKLTGREVELAQESHAVGIAMGGSRSWSARVRLMLEKGPSDPEVRKMLDDPMLGFDRFAVIRSGLISWTYPRPLRPDATKPEKKDAAPFVDPINDLDDEAADFIASAILKLTKPALFLTAEQQAALKKND